MSNSSGIELNKVIFPMLLWTQSKSCQAICGMEGEYLVDFLGLLNFMQNGQSKITA